jgi:hypothetical protein
MRLAMHGDGKDRGGGRFDEVLADCSCRRSVGGRQILSGASVLGSFAGGEALEASGGAVAGSPSTVWSALAVNSCWRELAGRRTHAALMSAVKTGRLGRLVHSKLRIFYYCASPLRRVLVNAASWMKLAEQNDLQAAQLEE